MDLGGAGRDSRPASPFVDAVDDLPGNNSVVWGIPCLNVGYGVCFVTLLEGIYVLYNVWLTDDASLSEVMFVHLDERNPLVKRLRTVFVVLGFGDLIAAAAGALGLFLATRIGFKVASSSRELFVALTLWRAVVTLIVGPWIATCLALEPDSADTKRGPVVVQTLIYVAFHLFVLWHSLIVVVSSVFKRRRIEQESESDASAARELPLAKASSCSTTQNVAKESCFLFGLPLEGTVVVYALLLGVVFSWWTYLSQTVGGWAFMLDVPHVHCTFILETFVFPVSAVAAFIGLLALMWSSPPGIKPESANGPAPPHAQEWVLEYTESREVHARASKRTTVALLLFFMINVVRLGLFVPITGVALLTRNTCGVHVKALSSLSTRSSILSTPVPIYCTVGDLLSLVAVTATLFFDVLLVRASFLLWRLKRWAIRGDGLRQDRGASHYGSAVTDGWSGHVSLAASSFERDGAIGRVIKEVAL
eukprot:TRINITY_DN31943_c0_g1_i1.p1 TRINITY_DN31943_c0_g1~~TRINITY_DN31943_c0_g1_i1.p1  ORF type:complete len:477 (+),score=51.07 TRINITY_DN31943_c0_g1_i1:97-1527(+)